MATTAVGSAANLRTEEAGHPRRWLVLAIMSFATFVLFADNTIANTALPSIARDLHATTSNLQWIVDSYVLMLAGLLLVGGAVADIFGRKRWFAVGMIVFAAGATTAALSTSAEQLILGRAIQGVGGAFVMPTTLSIITSVFPRGTRAKAIGIWTGVTGLAMGFGPVLGGYVVDTAQWQTVFWLHLPAVALILVGLAVVPESRDARKRRIDIPGAVFGTAALISLVYAIISGGEAGWTSAVVVLSAVVSAAMFAAFAVVEAHTSDPMLPLQFFRQRDFTTAVVIIGLVFFTVSVTFFFLTQYYQLVQGRSALGAGLLGVPCALAMGVGAPLSAILVKRVGPKVLVVSAMASLALGMALLSQLSVDTSTWQIVGTVCLFGLAGGLGLVPLTDSVMAAVPVESGRCSLSCQRCEPRTRHRTGHRCDGQPRQRNVSGQCRSWAWRRSAARNSSSCRRGHRDRGSYRAHPSSGRRRAHARHRQRGVRGRHRQWLPHRRSGAADSDGRSRRLPSEPIPPPPGGGGRGGINASRGVHRRRGIRSHVDRRPNPSATSGPCAGAAYLCPEFRSGASGPSVPHEERRGCVSRVGLLLQRTRTDSCDHVTQKDRSNGWCRPNTSVPVGVGHGEVRSVGKVPNGGPSGWQIDHEFMVASPESAKC